MDWMLSLVGTTYTKGGNSPEKGFDCYGLTRWVLRKGLGIELPEKSVGWRRHGIILPVSTEIRRYDVLMFRVRSKMVDHIGIAVSAADFIHAEETFKAVVCEPISRRMMHLKAIGRPHAS